MVVEEKMIIKQIVEAFHVIREKKASIILLAIFVNAFK